MALAAWAPAPTPGQGPRPEGPAHLAAILNLQRQPSLSPAGHPLHILQASASPGVWDPLVSFLGAGSDVTELMLSQPEIQTGTRRLHSTRAFARQVPTPASGPTGCGNAHKPRGSREDFSLLPPGP